MNNLSSYCGLTDAKVRASVKDLPVIAQIQKIGVMWIWILLLVPGTAILYKVFRPKKEQKIILRKPDYKKDLIYLMQFPVSPTIRSISPFSIKLETFLRLKKIPYEPVYCRKFDSKKRYIPYIELNGEQMSDSNLIIQELEKRGDSYKFNKCF